MKNAINKILRKFGAEVHGIGYIEKLKNSSTEKNEWDKQVALLNGNASTIIDVGANRGDTTAIYLNKFPKATIHAFEPFPDSYKQFLDKHQSNNRVVFNSTALGDKIGKEILNVNHSVDTNSILQSTKLGATSDKSCETETQIEIITDTLDHYCTEKNIKQIDILKIDVQGFELNVLKGAINMLQEKKVKLIYTESYFVQQYVNQPLFHEIAALLYQYDFVLQDIYDPYYSTKNILWCDAMFVSKTL